VAVVFNGCIYNHAELRRELEQQGCVFASDHSDTEVLVQGWRAWGPKLFEVLEGMYAFVGWDRERASLFHACDRHREKPLYQYSTATYVRERLELKHFEPTSQIRILASSTAACVSLAAHIGATDPTSVARHFTGRHIVFPYDWLQYGAAGERIGDHFTWAHNSDSLAMLTSREVIQPPDAAFYRPPTQFVVDKYRDEPAPLDESRTESLLRQSVIQRLITDVPLGCFLSGGVDSSLIAAFAQDHLRARGQRLQTFTMQMPDGAYDESPHAQAVAEHLQTQHHVLSCEPNVADDLIKLIEQLGLPFGDSSLLPTYWLCKAARQHVKVALAGDGGDELFAGYDRHLAGLFLNKYGKFLRTLSADLFYSDDPKASRNKFARLIDAAKHAGYVELLAIFPSSMYAKLINTPMDEKWMKEVRSRSRQCFPWDHDTMHYLPDDLLRKTDTASMAVALEVRCPFLSRELSAAAWHTPASVLLPGGQRKGLLRAVARKFIPPAIIDRPKQGFAVPIGDWLRTNHGQLRDLYHDMVIAARDPFPASLLDLEINRTYVQQLTDEHMASKRDHAQRLYLLLVFAIWCRWMGKVAANERTSERANEGGGKVAEGGGVGAEKRGGGR
jgi:asparagine synthase (glutamine-hydrolysing)